MMKKLLSLAFSLLVVSNSFAAQETDKEKEIAVKEVAGLLAAKYEGQDLSNPVILEELACDCAEFIDSSMHVTPKERNQMFAILLVIAVGFAAGYGLKYYLECRKTKEAAVAACQAAAVQAATQAATQAAEARRFAETPAGQVATARAALGAAAVGTAEHHAAQQALVLAEAALANANDAEFAIRLTAARQLVAVDAARVAATPEGRAAAARAVENRNAKIRAAAEQLYAGRAAGDAQQAANEAIRAAGDAQRAVNFAMQFVDDARQDAYYAQRGDAA